MNEVMRKDFTPEELAALMFNVGCDMLSIVTRYERGYGPVPKNPDEDDQSWDETAWERDLDASDVKKMREVLRPFESAPNAWIQSMITGTVMTRDLSFLHAWWSTFTEAISNTNFPDTMFGNEHVWSSDEVSNLMPFCMLENGVLTVQMFVDYRDATEWRIDVDSDCSIPDERWFGWYRFRVAVDDTHCFMGDITVQLPGALSVSEHFAPIYLR